MDIKYCFKCRKKIATDKVCTHIQDDNKHRDYCQPCWKVINADGNLKTVQEQQSPKKTKPSKRKELTESRHTKISRKSDSSLYDSAILSRAREREKKKQNTQVSRRPTTQQDSDIQRRGGSRPSTDAEPRRTARERREYLIDDRQSKSPLPLILVGIVILAMIIIGYAMLTKIKEQNDAQDDTSQVDDSGQPKLPAPDQETRDEYNELIRKSEAESISGKVERKQLELLAIRAEGTTLQPKIETRMQAIREFERLESLISKDVLRLNAIREQYTVVKAMTGIGIWERKASSKWQSAIADHARITESMFNDNVLPELDKARQTKKFQPAYDAIDSFISKVDRCEAAPKQWHAVLEEELELLKAQEKRSLEKPDDLPPNEWHDAIKDDAEFTKLEFGGMGKWELQDGILTVDSEAGDSWVVLDVSDIERYDIEFSLIGDCLDMYLALRFEGEAVDLEEDFVVRLKYNRLSSARHTVRLALAKNGKLKFIVDGRDRAGGRRWMSETTKGRFAIMFRGAVFMEFSKLRFRRQEP